MTLEQLQSKREGLKAQLTQLQANINAVSGAIQLCDQLIAEDQAPIEAPAEVKE